jgi:hypothetical protein
MDHDRNQIPSYESWLAPSPEICLRGDCKRTFGEVESLIHIQVQVKARKRSRHPETTVEKNALVALAELSLYL